MEKRPGAPSAPGNEGLMLDYPALKEWFKAVVGVRPPSRLQIYRWEKAAAFPCRAYLGSRCVWSRRELDEWIESKLDDDRPRTRWRSARMLKQEIESLRRAVP